MSGRPRGAYIELNWFHGEVMPSFARIADDAGLDLDFFVLRENLASDPFSGIAIDGRVTPIEVTDPHNPCELPTGLEDHWTSKNYDFVIIGTAEPSDRVRFAQRIPLPKLLVLHNPPSNLPVLPDISWAVLTDESARRHPEAICVRPWFAGEAHLANTSTHPRFGVVGNHQMRRRNYGSLLRALVELRHKGVSSTDCEVRIIGRWSDGFLPESQRSGLDGERLFAEAERRGVIDYLVLESEQELSHGEVRAAMASCRYALPLIDDCFLATRRYIAGKASGGLNQAIGMLTIPVINERFAATMGLTGCHTYRLDDVASGMIAALQGEDDVFVERLAECRADGLARSADSLRGWVERL